jgi:glycosyltransferase involved in cell wall biosynthesis
MGKVSVILPCYNGSRWIESAINSVLGQTYGNLELVVVDDGSTDSSKEIVVPYLPDERVRYIYQENRGFSAAVNRGIKESRGDLIGFIGQDDLWLPNKLELQVKYLSENKDLDLVHSSYFVIDPQGRIVGIRNVEIPNVSSKRKLIEKLFLVNFIGFETVLVKRRCFDEVGFFDERMKGFSDHDMWLRIAGSFTIEGYIELPLVKKREHEFQLSKFRIEAVLKDEFLTVRKAILCYPFLKMLERKKLASLYYAWGIALLQKGNKKEAMQKFLQAIKCQPWKLKATAAYIAPTLYTFVWDNYQRYAPEVHKGLRWVEG